MISLLVKVPYMCNAPARVGNLTDSRVQRRQAVRMGAVVHSINTYVHCSSWLCFALCAPSLMCGQCLVLQVRMVSSPDFAACAVDVANVTSYMGRGSKLGPLFGLIFRRSSCQHPLLAGALGG